MAFGFKRKKEDALDKQTDDLYNQIGGLKMENEWLKKVEMRSYEVMKALTLNQSCPGIPDHFIIRYSKNYAK